MSLRGVRRRGNRVQWESRNDRGNTGQQGAVCSIARDCHVASGQAPRNVRHALIGTRVRSYEILNLVQDDEEELKPLFPTKRKRLHEQHWSRVHAFGKLPALPVRSQLCPTTLPVVLPGVLDRMSR
jgi:hypothetical protein